MDLPRESPLNPNHELAQAVMSNHEPTCEEILKESLQRVGIEVQLPKSDSLKAMQESYEKAWSNMRDSGGFLEIGGEDPINHPSHYKSGTIEAIEVIEAFELGFHLGNVVKYILRADKKGSRLENLKKAEWYLKREIEKEEQ